MFNFEKIEIYPENIFDNKYKDFIKTCTFDFCNEKYTGVLLDKEVSNDEFRIFSNSYIKYKSSSLTRDTLLFFKESSKDEFEKVLNYNELKTYFFKSLVKYEYQQFFNNNPNILGMTFKMLTEYGADVSECDTTESISTIVTRLNVYLILAGNEDKVNLTLKEINRKKGIEFHILSPRDFLSECKFIQSEYVTIRI